ncbi:MULTISPECIES: hypothetical protein [unclassified Bacillus (in: firmicutes)]|uniref:hypothetical protein n=1 Tax=unclassified Bacillus (in: firmicutes) TaxID=185979 RepID=UPI000B89B2ED|nr:MULTISPECIES: hypothetical protein [unclassified Bacillus (in: firmicutes)]
MRKAYIINTNKTNWPEDEQDMLVNEKCAAYFSPWKEKINHIQPNDLVFLYSNGNGIIARGIATGVCEQGNYINRDGLHVDEQNYMYLNRFERLQEPISAAEINKVVGYSVVFGRTMIPMDYDSGLTLWQAITKNYLNGRNLVATD